VAAEDDVEGMEQHAGSGIGAGLINRAGGWANLLGLTLQL